MWIDTGWTQRLTPSWQFKSLIWGISSGFPLANHFDLPGSESVFGIPQDPPNVCAKMDSTQEGYGQFGVTPLLTSKDLSSWEDLLDFENENYVVSYLLSGQGPASSLNCPAILILEYRSTGIESPIAYPGRGIYLLPQIPHERCSPQEIFMGKMKDKGLSSIASSGWQGACRLYLVGVTELLPCLIKGPQGDFCCYFGRIGYGEWLESLHHHYPVMPQRKQTK